jgi:uncharacterized membrane protein
MNMDRKIIVGAVALVVLLFAATVYFYNHALVDLAAGSCSDASDNCPHEKIVGTQNAIIAALIAVIAILAGSGAYLLFWQKPHLAASHFAGAGETHKKPDESSLGEEEKKLLGVVREGDGSVFQSEIMKKMGCSKVKVSRILDRLESKGFVERKRRGMANLVVLK